MQTKKRILIADKQALTLAGILALLEKHPVDVVGTVIRFEELADQLQALKPDILLIDYAIGGEACLDTLGKLSSFSPDTTLFLLSSEKDKASILRALQTGAPVYVTKDCSAQEIERAIEASIKGEKFYCQSVLNLIIDKHFVQAAEPIESGVLTAREREVLALLAKGKQTQAVAELLYLSPHTVHTHRKSIIKKLNIKSPTEFVVRAMDLGLL
ncbi:MAG: DNA-binding response regulator [Cytophagia bacterium]|nr:DNA-binding response regulator [Cytophagia bacterium]